MSDIRKTVRGVSCLALVWLLAGCATSPKATVTGRQPAGLDSDDAVEQFVGGGGKAVVFFHSPKCPYCRAVMRGMNADMPRYPSAVRIGIVNIREIGARWDVHGGKVPCLAFFENGSMKDKTSGWRPRGMIRSSITSFFKE